MRCIIGKAVAALLLVCAMAARADPPLIAAASDLRFALEALAAAFTAETRREVRLAFGSSGNLYRQLLQGAPYQMFFSADEEFVFQLADAGKAEDRGTLYAVGRIGIIVPSGSPLKADGQLQDLKAALADGRLKKFAIANPEHAPYGRRAEEALRHCGLWEQIQDRLVLGENVSQAAQFATSGNADGGIIAYSLALAPELAGLGEFALIPDSWHKPLRQRMVLIAGAGDTTRAFYRYVQQPVARAILRQYGFVLPDTEATEDR